MINCGHDPVTFIDGVSYPRYEETQDFEQNAKEYAESQKQRQLERNVRDAKREAIAQDAAGNKEAFEQAALKVRKANADYKEYCTDKGLTPRNDRLQVLTSVEGTGYNRSISSKAVWAARKQESATETRARTILQHNEEDPIRDVLGSGTTSHPKEVQRIKQSWAEKGVSVSYRSGAMGYAPGLSPGSHGSVVMDEEASIGAWRHENRHVLDDEANGWPGFSFYDTPGKLIAFEHRGYAEEIAIARELGNKELEKAIRRLQKKRDEQIRNEYKREKP